MINFDNIEYVKTSIYATTALTPFEPTQFKGLGKILGTVIGVVAAIAVPFLAPTIGLALGGGFFSSIAGQALIGAGLGAIGGGVSSAVSGGDILKGALLGAAGGGLVSGGGAFLGGAGLTMSAADAAAAAAPTTVGGTYGALDAALSGGAAAAAGGGTYGALDAALAPATSTTGLVGAGTGASTATQTGASGATGTLAASGGTAVSTGFKTAAVQTLMNGGTQLLQSMAPDQQAQIFKQMQAEMNATAQTDQEAYLAQKKIFDEYYNYAKSLNPEFFAQIERANEAQRQATTWQDSERSLRGSGYGDATIQAEKRKQQVAGAAGLATASTTGFIKGQGAQGQAYQTAAGLVPHRSPTTMTNLQNMYTYAGTQQADRAGGVAGLMAPWSVYAQDRIENPSMYKSVVA